MKLSLPSFLDLPKFHSPVSRCLSHCRRLFTLGSRLPVIAAIHFPLPTSGIQEWADTEYSI